MKEIRATFNNLSDRQVMLLLAGIGIIASLFSGLISILYHVASGPEWLVGFLQNFSTEMFGALLTFVLLQLIVGTRQEKQRLIRDLASSVNTVAKRAAEELHTQGWLEDGSLSNIILHSACLKEAYLGYANLQSANLVSATLDAAILEQSNLQNADLTGASLHSANLTGANLENADLSWTTLEQANMRSACMKGVDLFEANLQQANLMGVNLQDANLLSTNLQEANLAGAKFNEKTVLPDHSTWQPSTDLERFTNPNHPKFWHMPKSVKIHHV